VPLFRELKMKGKAAEQFYEVEGEIRDVVAVGKDQAHVRVWTKRPDSRMPKATALYERTFTAVKSGESWTFQLHILLAGTPVIEKVKRRTTDGKEVEVYAEHDSSGSNDEKTWKECKPIAHAGREGMIKEITAALAKYAEVLKTSQNPDRAGSKRRLQNAERSPRVPDAASSLLSFR